MSSILHRDDIYNTQYKRNFTKVSWKLWNLHSVFFTIYFYLAPFWDFEWLIIGGEGGLLLFWILWTISWWIVEKQIQVNINIENSLMLYCVYCHQFKRGLQSIKYIETSAMIYFYICVMVWWWYRIITIKGRGSFCLLRVLTLK